MIKPTSLVSLLTAPLLAALVLAGCTAQPAPDDDQRVTVVASTNVYGDLALAVGGDAVEVTSIIDDPAQDPHQFEANGRVQLALSRADVVIVNGGGYDDFATQMLEAAGNDQAVVVDAVELSGRDATAEGFNEHVWYDYPTVGAVIDAVAEALSAAAPAEADGFAAAAARLQEGLSGLEQRVADLAATASGQGVVITEPVPLYLLDALGLENLTPPEFSEAIEEDTDVSPALLQSVLDALADGSASVVVYNTQTGGPQTDAILGAAAERGVPVVGVTETLPAGEDYLGWQGGYLDQLQQALSD